MGADPGSVIWLVSRVGPKYQAQEEPCIHLSIDGAETGWKRNQSHLCTRKSRSKAGHSSGL